MVKFTYLSLSFLNHLYHLYLMRLSGGLSSLKYVNLHWNLNSERQE